MVIVAEVRSAQVPVEIFGFEVQREDVGEDRIHAAAISRVAFGFRSVGVISGDIWRRCRSFLSGADFGHGQFLLSFLG
jgi:hypothetical protein